MARAGQVLTPEEVREYQAYGNAGVTVPDKFSNVVTENVDHRGVIYRHATDEEVRAAQESAKTADETGQAHTKLTEKVRAEAAKRGAVIDIPPLPSEKPV